MKRITHVLDPNKIVTTEARDGRFVVRIFSDRGINSFDVTYEGEHGGCLQVGGTMAMYTSFEMMRCQFLDWWIENFTNYSPINTTPILFRFSTWIFEQRFGARKDRMDDPYDHPSIDDPDF